MWGEFKYQATKQTINQNCQEVEIKRKLNSGNAS